MTKKSVLNKKHKYNKYIHNLVLKRELKVKAEMKF